MTVFHTSLFVISIGIFANGKDKHHGSSPLKQSLPRDPSFSVPFAVDEIKLNEHKHSEIQIVADASSSGDLRREGMYEVR